MAKFIGLLLLFVLSGCSAFSQASDSENTNDKPTSFSLSSFSFEMISDSEVSFLLSEKEVEDSWGTPERIIEKLAKEHDFLFEKGKEILFEPLHKISPHEFTADEQQEKNLAYKYVIGNDEYTLKNLISAESSDQIYVIEKNGKEIFRSEMCYGAEGPIIDARLVKNIPAFTFRKTCAQTNSLPQLNIFYNGKNINENAFPKEAHYLFSYKDKIGFVGKDTDGKERIFFNGMSISSTYDSIITSSCCDTIRPIFKVYDNGALLFRALKNNQYYVVEVNLNSFINEEVEKSFVSEDPEYMTEAAIVDLPTHLARAGEFEKLHN